MSRSWAAGAATTKATEMKSRLVQATVNQLNRMLHLRDFELVRTWGKSEDFAEYIPFTKTIRAAQKNGMKLEAYVEERYNVEGATKQTIEGMDRLGVFEAPIRQVCEIGPGTGRYLSRVMERCSPGRYEVYETATQWRDWLVETFGVVACKTDGEALQETASSSVELVHSHKVYPGVPVFATLHYFIEMARVVRPGGFVVFDVLTEECLTDEIVDTWIESGIRYPCCMMPKAFVLGLFARRKCEFKGSFMVRMRPGITEVLVFQRRL